MAFMIDTEHCVISTFEDGATSETFVFYNVFHKEETEGGYEFLVLDGTFANHADAVAYADYRESSSAVPADTAAEWLAFEHTNLYLLKELDKISRASRKAEDHLFPFDTHVVVANCRRCLIEALH